jgi:hypothetical protein
MSSRLQDEGQTTALFRSIARDLFRRGQVFTSR